MFCRKCGAPLADDSVFCSKCGAKVIDIRAGQREDTSTETNGFSTGTFSTETPSDVGSAPDHSGFYAGTENSGSRTGDYTPSGAGFSASTEGGAASGGDAGWYQTDSGETYAESDRKSRLAAGLLGIFLGGLGIHNFYLGHVGRGIAQIFLNCLCGIGSIWALIEAIMILAGSINTDAKGIPLKD